MKRHYYPVFEGERDGKKVLLKRCKCGRIGLVCDGPEAEFYMSRRQGKLRPSHLCKPCMKKHKTTRQRERYATDPVLRAYRKAQYEKWLEKPGNREKAREANRRWRAKKKKEDPEYKREYDRMNYRLRRMRKGQGAREIGPKSKRWLERHSQPRIDGELFRRWLQAYQEAYPYDLTQEELADHLHINQRSVSRLLAGEYERVALDTVDKALLHAVLCVELDGKLIITLDDLYGEGQVERSLAA